MKKTTGWIVLPVMTALALLLALSGCAQEQENTAQSDAQAKETVLRFCDEIFGSAADAGTAETYHIRVTDALNGGRVDEYDCPRGVNRWGEAFSLTDGMSEEETFAAATGSLSGFPPACRRRRKQRSMICEWTARRWIMKLLRTSSVRSSPPI